MFIAVVGYKGGIGKTTTAVHIAELLADEGRTLLIDADPNQSAHKWAARGGDEFPVPVCSLVDLVSLDEKPEHTVIDTAARPSPEELERFVKASNLLILPTAPDALATDVFVQTLQPIIESGAAFKVLITMAETDARKKAAAKLRAGLESQGVPVFDKPIRRYAAYQKATVRGCTVGMVKGDPNAKIAAMDYQAAFKEMISEL